MGAKNLRLVSFAPWLGSTDTENVCISASGWSPRTKSLGSRTLGQPG
jgi:hypothetical protein